MKLCSTIFFSSLSWPGSRPTDPAQCGQLPIPSFTSRVFFGSFSKSDFIPKSISDLPFNAKFRASFPTLDFDLIPFSSQNSLIR